LLFPTSSVELASPKPLLVS